MVDRTMTPKRRFLAGIMGGRVDRTPVGSPTSVATVDQMDLTGAFFPDVHTDGRKAAQLAAGAYDILGYDAIMPVFSVTQEAAGLGCEMNWGSIADMPTVRKHIFENPEDVRIPDGFLEHPAIASCLEAIQILRHNYGHKVCIIGKVMGPWTLSYNTHGLQDFLIKTKLEPDTVRGFLDRLKAVTILFGKAQIAAGADMLCLADHATGDLVRGTMYRDFLLPVHREILTELGCPMVLHICGKTLDRMGFIADAGYDAFHFDSKNDAFDAMRTMDGRISLVGNINNPEVLYLGTPEMVAERTRHALKAGVQVVGPECAVPLRTPLENLKMITQTVVENA